MERVAGIEPACLTWKDSALPLSYTRLQADIENRNRIEGKHILKRPILSQLRSDFYKALSSDQFVTRYVLMNSPAESAQVICNQRTTLTSVVEWSFNRQSELRRSSEWIRIYFFSRNRGSDTSPHEGWLRSSTSSSVNRVIVSPL